MEASVVSRADIRVGLVVSAVFGGLVVVFAVILACLLWGPK